LKAVVLDESLDAANADGLAGLLEFLGKNFGGGVGVEEAKAKQLAKRFVRTTRAGLGAGRMAEQSRAAVFLEDLAELVVTLPAEAEQVGSLGGSQVGAFAEDEHQKFVGEFVLGAEAQGASRSVELVFRKVEAHR
jgi:hypothetical protein